MADFHDEISDVMDPTYFFRMWTVVMSPALERWAMPTTATPLALTPPD